MEKNSLPDKTGHFGIFGGRYVAETIMPALLELEEAYGACRADPSFKKELALMQATRRDRLGKQRSLPGTQSTVALNQSSSNVPHWRLNLKKNRFCKPLC